ncbi:hypothetical protein ASPCAL13304 [Aspergillus calidoustus]|uniref:F-box domain-containing protein n=1 Tax=Aspergillus calidoustus TaxID=454130 RepID=A0A0U5GER0_ASPCI|nr:hypothetical protein ASPCAL13304 [Aspergillus calidoustus]
MLQDLPPELIGDIISYLDKPDLARIRLASKHLESLATPLLFGDITIHVDENDPVNIPIQRALNLSFGSDRNLLHFAKRITFTSQFRVNYTKRCLHHYRGIVEDESDDVWGSGSGDGDEEQDEEVEREEERGRDDAEDEKNVGDKQEDLTEEETRQTEETVRSSERREKDEVEDDDSESIETRYPDDDLLEPYQLTETEQRDLAKYIPWEYDAENPAEITQIKNRVMAMLIRCREGSLTEFRCHLLLPLL